MEDYVEKLWSTVKGWAEKNTQGFVCAYIPKEQTDLTDSIETIKPYRDYFRIWMSQMYLSKEREWFTDWYPAVHTSVQLKFASRTVKISHVTGPDEEHSRGVKLDYAVTDLLPFAGGKVEIESGLIALKGKNYISASISILQEFSGLVAAPISQALDIAQKVSSGMDRLVGANNGEVRLAFHREFVAAGGGGSELKPGYIAVVAASPDEVNENSLSVKGSQLYFGNPARRFEGSNYMLFRVEGRSDRDDWRFPIIEEAMNSSIEAALKGKVKDAEEFQTAALTAVWQSPDLAPQDRRRVVDAIKVEIASATGQERGAVRDSKRNLDQVMKARAMPLEAALRQPPLTREEVMGRA
jgi:hypothetical protein